MMGHFQELVLLPHSPQNEGGYYTHREDQPGEQVTWPAALEMELVWFLVLPVRGASYQKSLSFLIKPKHLNIV